MQPVVVEPGDPFDESVDRGSDDDELALSSVSRPELEADDRPCLQRGRQALKRARVGGVLATLDARDDRRRRSHPAGQLGLRDVECSATKDDDARQRFKRGEALMLRANAGSPSFPSRSSGTVAPTGLINSELFARGMVGDVSVC